MPVHSQWYTSRPNTEGAADVGATLSHPNLRAYAERLAAYAILLLAVLVVTPQAAVGAPTEPEATYSGAARTVAEAAVSPADISLETTDASIALGDPFAYDAVAEVGEDTDAVRFRFQLLRPTGRLVFQRTYSFDRPEAGSLRHTFTRETSDVLTRPGAYPVRLEVAVTKGGETVESVLDTLLFVYDPSAPRVPVVLVARVSAQPLADPQGRFVFDPARYTRARDEVRVLSSWLLSNPDARITLAVSPLLLREWSRIAGGYELAGPEGTRSVPSSSTVSRTYAATLELLTRALSTGRLELTAMGFSDPDLAALAAAGLIDDTAEQYDRGLSAVYASLEATPSTGTVPAGGCVPPSAVPELREADIGYLVVSTRCVRSNDATVPSGSYRLAAGGPALLVTDDPSGAAFRSRDASRAVGRAFARTATDSPGPMVISVDLGAGAGNARAFSACAEELMSHPWVTPRLGREAAGPTKRSAELTWARVARDEPPDYWAEVADARSWARALASALGGSTTEVLTAQNDSLIAESSAWAGPDGRWSLADRGRTFADAASRTASELLDEVSVTVAPVTLAGDSGDVPVTITNGTERGLNIQLIVVASNGARLVNDADGRRVLRLQPQDTYVEIPVDLRTAIAGRVRVVAMSGGREIDSATVTVRASYLDRIALMGAVVLIMIGILVFVIRRVRAEEGSSGASVKPAKYTERVGSRDSREHTDQNEPPEEGRP